MSDYATESFNWMKNVNECWIEIGKEIETIRNGKYAESGFEKSIMDSYKIAGIGDVTLAQFKEVITLVQEKKIIPDF